jgi:hypothetical protein
LKSPVDQLFVAYGKIISCPIILKGESALHDRLGHPDFAAHRDRLPLGYIELKAPGKGVNPEIYKGHDRDQWKRFQTVVLGHDRGPMFQTNILFSPLYRLLNEGGFSFHNPPRPAEISSA